MARFFVYRPQRVTQGSAQFLGYTIGTLYAVNTLGAVFGAFFVWGLLLLPLLNVSATLHWLLILVAAALFFVAGVGA